MASQKENFIAALRDIEVTTDVLLEAIQRPDEDKAHEAISVMLMQGLHVFGPEHPAMQQFFPVWDAIQRHIEASDMDLALSQTNTWKAQLLEVLDLVENS